jgi:hypothetical protein
MHKTEWSIADAKGKLSEVLTHAERESQVITRRHRRYIVIDGDAYARLIGGAPTVKALLLGGPGLEGVDLKRDRSTGRKMLP